MYIYIYKQQLVIITLKKFSCSIIYFFFTSINVSGIRTHQTAWRRSASAAADGPDGPEQRPWKSRDQSMAQGI